MRVPRVAGVRTSSTLGRYSSAIRAACANERSCGSARGAISNGRPYRDLIVPIERNIPALYLRWAIDALPMGHLRGRNWSLNFDFIGWELAEFYDKPGPFLGPHVRSLPEAG
jgi:hypothetical protein